MWRSVVMVKLVKRISQPDLARAQTLRYSTVVQDRSPSLNNGSRMSSDDDESNSLPIFQDPGKRVKHNLGWNVPRDDKIIFLVNTLLNLQDSKDAVYGALDAWAAWERDFPIGLLKNALHALEKLQQWHRVIQVIKWMLSRGQGTTMGTYGQLIRALDMDHRVKEAHEIWVKKVGHDLQPVPWKLCKLMIGVYYRNKMPDNLVKLFKGMEVYDRKLYDKSVLLKIVDSYEMLGLAEEKDRVFKKYSDLIDETSKQNYIATSKSDLLDAIVMDCLHSPDGGGGEEIKHYFLLLSSCLDSILHAEHKSILEEMRADYDLLQSTRYKGTANGEEEEAAGSQLISAISDPNNSEFAAYKPNGIGEKWLEGQFESNFAMPSIMALDFKYLFGGYKPKNANEIPNEESRIAVATRFQRAFMQLLYNAQFEELSEADLMLTSALNTDYLLTLPVNVDWKKASESKAIIFRRGYTTEKQKGLLIGEKLDYLQSRLLLQIFFLVAKPLRKVGTWLAEAVKQSIQGQDTEVWTKRMNLWLKEMSLSQWPYWFDENTYNNEQGVDQYSNEDLPIWLAAQRAVNRYEGILSSLGPRSRLLRKFLTWMELIPSMPKRPSELEPNVNTFESHLRPISLPRISLSDIWEPATLKFCGNDLWKMLKAAFSILSSKSILQEPAFQELILLYTEEMDEIETMDASEVPLLQLKIYEKIPIPDLPVIFPHKKLSFRILDTVRLDAATIVGLLAFFINYKFEDIKSSPSAVLLDVIAISALIISVTRILLGYKQTWDRYQLLVNRTLYEKTVASGFGSVHFLLDASEQQQYKEAILAYAILLKEENGQATCIGGVKDRCQRFMYNVFKEKVDMPIHKAINTLARLGLINENSINGQTKVQAVPCPDAYEILKRRWNSLLTDIP